MILSNLTIPLSKYRHNMTTELKLSFQLTDKGHIWSYDCFSYIGTAAQAAREYNQRYDTGEEISVKDLCDDGHAIGNIPKFFRELFGENSEDSIHVDDSGILRVPNAANFTEAVQLLLERF